MVHYQPEFILVLKHHLEKLSLMQNSYHKECAISGSTINLTNVKINLILLQICLFLTHEELFYCFLPLVFPSKTIFVQAAIRYHNFLPFVLAKPLNDKSSGAAVCGGDFEGYEV